MGNPLTTIPPLPRSSDVCVLGNKRKKVKEGRMPDFRRIPDKAGGLDEEIDNFIG